MSAIDFNPSEHTHKNQFPAADCTSIFLSSFEDSIYSVSDTPTQHTCGASKTNKNLTNGLKITTHQRLFKIKKHKFSLNFQSRPSKQHFLFLKIKIFSLSLLSHRSLFQISIATAHCLASLSELRYRK